MKRVFDPSHFEERPRQPARELELNQGSRRKLDRCLGISRLLRYFLHAWIKPGRTYRILDLATGTGDASRLIADWARKKKITLQIDAMDFYPSLLEIARRQAVDYPEITFVRADSRSHSPESTYDLVCCLNALRNFSAEDAVRVIRRAGESSHDKVLVAGLDRNLASLPGFYFVTAAIFGLPVKKSDARRSIGRSFSFDELDELAQRAGWVNYRHRRFLPASQAIWMSKRDEQGVTECGLTVPDFAG
jgi:SAM-dependent methyltransferase